MQRTATIIQWIGFIISLVILVMLINNSLDHNTSGIIMLISGSLVIVGGLLKRDHILVLLSLVFAFLAIALYFFISQSIGYKISISISILLAIAYYIPTKKNDKGNSSLTTK